MPTPHPSTDRVLRLVFTCEHATNRVPREYAALFRGRQELLNSHRGYDPGALALAEFLVDWFPGAAPVLATTVSRLLVECNRSPHHPRVFSEVSKTLGAAARQQVLATYYEPHRQAVHDRVQRVALAGAAALHIGVHSFTPVLDGVARTADIGLLYDPSRRGEAAFALHWADAIRRADGACRVRRNYPYRGVSDGLTTALRREFEDEEYIGIELEVNNALLIGSVSRRRHIHRLIASTLGIVLVERLNARSYARRSSFLVQTAPSP